MKSNYDSNKLKKYENKVLDKIVSICKENDIKYYLAYGTLLGAIRHKGFIPWDDDIDIYMKPEDYYKFKEVMLKSPDKEYFYQSFETEKYYSLTFAKLRMNNTSIIEERLKDEKIHTGIYVDIFPLLPFPNDKKRQDKFFKRLKIMNLLIEADLKDKVKYDHYGKVGKILSTIARFIPRIIRNKIAASELKKCLLTKDSYDKYFCVFDHKTFDKDLFDNEIMVEFEGKEYASPRDYDRYLTSMYGDYMTPPPVNKRGGHSFISVDFDTNNNQKIDFVIMWVDGSDKKWLEEKNKYSAKKIDVTNAINRYRDMGILKYWFRGVEKFTPWVNKIHFVTWGHVPEWLDVNNPKLNIVKHEDFIPKKFLPLFNSCAIEINLHRIKGLAENFVYFNDDMFLLRPIDEKYFFENNLPKDLWRDNIPYCDENTDTVFEHHLLNVKMLISRHFNKRKVMNKYFSKCINPKYGKRNIRFLMLYKWPYMAGFDNFHVAAPFLKSTFEEVWEKEKEVLEQTASAKFRTVYDINQYAFQLWQIYSGKFVPKSHKEVGKFFSLSKDNKALFDCIDNQTAEQICINDSDLSINYEKVTKELQEHFDKILPDKSSFEK